MKKKPNIQGFCCDGARSGPPVEQPATSANVGPAARHGTSLTIGGRKMKNISPSKLAGLIGIALVVFYGMFAFFARHLLAGAADHLKVVMFSCIVCAWMMLWLKTGDRLGKKSVGLRVAVFAAASIAIPLAMGLLRSFSGKDPVWHELWDTTPVVFMLPVIQSIFAHPNEKQETDTAGTDTTGPSPVVSDLNRSPEER